MHFSRNIIPMITLCCFFLTSTTLHALPTSRIGYTIQAGAFREVGNAERFAARLNRMNLVAVYHRKENSFYAVTFGNFTTWTEANRTARQLWQQRIIEAYCIAEPRKKSTSFGTMSSSAMKQEAKQDSGNLGCLAALTAERFVGIPYHWGGNNVVEGLDCSGFVKAVYYLVGMDIPRTSREQFSKGSAIERASIRPGDLLFFGKRANQVSHVGIYIGNARFVHAPRRGQPIQVTPLKDEHYALRYVGARRYL